MMMDAWGAEMKGIEWEEQSKGSPI